MTRYATLAFAALLALGAAAQTEPPLAVDVRWGDVPVQAALQVDLSARKHLAIPELPSAPQLDGDLGDEAWDHAARTDTWMVNTGERPAPVQTTAWLGIHGGTLFVGARADEPNVGGILATVTEDGGPAWSDDCIELFVDGNLDLQSARQLVINSAGAVTALDNGPGDWRVDVARATRVGEDAWFAEFALPVAGLGLTGTDFGINICRERRAAGGTELSCWSPTGGGFHQPGRFGLASLPGGYLRGFAIGTGMLGHNELSITIENPDDRPRSLGTRLTWWQGDDIALERALGPYALEPGEAREVTFGYDIAMAGEPVQLEMAVLDETGKVLARQEVSQGVVDVLDMAAGRSVLVVGEGTMFARATLRITDDLLARSRLIIALFRRSDMALVARSEFAPPGGSAVRAELSLPDLEPGDYSLHVVLKSGDGDDARRIAEEKAMLHVLAPVE